MANPHSNKPRRGRRYSLWTLLAPAALVVVVVMSFNAVGRSGVLDDEQKSVKQTKTTTTKTTAKIPTNSAGEPKPRHRVVEGDTLQSIADLYQLTVDQLIGCNPQLPDPERLQVGTFLNVAQDRCKEAADDGVI